MSCIAIITARGGSKRIPYKNVRDFCGVPILTYSVRAALESGVFDEVMVSTDDEKIAAVARECGAVVPFLRSNQTSHDYATTSMVIEEVIKAYNQQGNEFKSLCCLYPTAPFVTADKLKDAYNVYQQSDATALVAVVKFSYPPQRCFVIDDDCFLRYKWPEYKDARSQDLKALYHDAGQFYFISTKDFLKEKSLVSQSTIPYILNETEVQDIDTVDDWRIAEIKYKAMLEKRNENKMEKIQTEQEAFWNGKFGSEYIQRNQDAKLFAAKIYMFSEVLKYTMDAQSFLELGANVGLNLQAIRTLLPKSSISGVEINADACDICRRITDVEVFEQSILNFQCEKKWDFVFTAGVLIHIAPEFLDEVYKILYEKSNRYIFIAEYYNPSPVEILYRGNKNKLFKRDFSGEIMDRYSDVKLLKYGFIYHRDNNFPSDDLNWFLMEKI